MLTALVGRFPLLRGLIDFVYPPLCAGCGEYDENPNGICDRCIEETDWWDKPIMLTDLNFTSRSDTDDNTPDSFPLFPAGNYIEPLQRVIVQYKFRGAVAVAPLVAQKVADQFGDQIRKLSPAVLVPIPLHPSREFIRGYNQALIFAEKLSILLDMPVDNDLLVRVKKRRPQARLTKIRRASNIRSVFAMAPDIDPAERCTRVILVDDVVTSGQTIFEARRTLAADGYVVVGAIAMAHRL